MKRLLLLLLLTLIPAISIADVSVGSFNIKHWGWNNDKDEARVAEILKRFDIIAVQEVMNDQAVKNMVTILNKTTDKKWQQMSSHPVGRGSYKEQYAFIWSDNVRYDSGAVVYIDDRDIYAREPLSAKFVSNKTGFEFVLANVHITFGDSVVDREEEIRALSSYWDWLGEVYPDTSRILAGDFNLWSHHDYFSPLVSKVNVAIESGATTLSPTDGKYASLYDNIFYDSSVNVTGSGIFTFPQKLGMTHKEARSVVSDHVPVYITIGNAKVDTSKLDGVIQKVDIVGISCIDINTSHKQDLMKLPRIGEARADDIIKGRPWSNVGELTKIKGIGSKTAQSIESHSELCQ
jgi:endonuclease/exonuclease/phosphatase family metal-dependent hydrolase